MAYCIVYNKPMDEIYTVSRFLDEINELVNPKKVTIQGEVNKVDIRGNAVYFTLIDPSDKSILNCFVWSFKLKSFGIDLKEGVEIKVLGYASVYKPFGKLSFQAEYISPVGEGAQKAAYEKLLKTLETAGYFAPERKRPIPPYIKTIGLITSENADAKKDFETHLGNFGFKIIFYDVRVEGLKSIDNIIEAINWFNQNTTDAEVLVLTRGGGSLESLQSFNSEAVAKAIFSSRIPIISAVGHENDITIADLTADLRASTPTHAGKILSQYWSQAQNLVDNYDSNIRSIFKKILNQLYTDLAILEKNLVDNSYLWLNRLNLRLNNFADKLTLADPKLRLKQGYSITLKNKKIIKSNSQVFPGDKITTLVFDGQFVSLIDEVK